MTALFLGCAALGGGFLLLQLVLSLVGVGDGHDGGHVGHVGHVGHDMEAGLQLFSIRTLSAGIGFFGVGGLAGLSLAGHTAVGVIVALALGVALGFGAMLGVAAATRAMLRLEDDGTVRIEGAVGTSGDVYLTIPGERRGIGKVHVPVQNRIVEYQALTPHNDALPTGSRILVVDVAGPDTVVVVPDPLTGTKEESHASR